MRLLLPACLVSGCSEYGLEGEKKTPEAAHPSVVATPDAVASTGHCSVYDQVVTITNDGDGVLEVSGVEVRGDGWVLDEVVVPFQLEAGDSTEVVVHGRTGEATLIVTSDDPEEPELRVPLSAYANVAPVAAITAPADADVLAEGADVTLAGTVSDDVDPPTALAVEWSSANGVIASGAGEPDGSTSATWAASTRSAGDNTVTLTVTDSCGETGSTSVAVCQDAATTYDSLALTGWHYEGMAYYDTTNAYLVLTDARTDAVGTAFETSTPVSGANVSIEFLFYVGGGTGADGISLTALDTARMTSYLGGTGCGIGYGGDAACTLGPALPGWSVEIDTYYNSEADRSEADHLAFTFDGDVDGYEVYAEVPELEDTGWHSLSVTVVAPHVLIALDGVTYVDQDIAGYYDFPAYVGFTAGTGGQTNWHLIDALQVTEYACD